MIGISKYIGIGTWTASGLLKAWTKIEVFGGKIELECTAYIYCCDYGNVTTITVYVSSFV